MVESCQYDIIYPMARYLVSLFLDACPVAVFPGAFYHAAFCSGVFLPVVFYPVVMVNKDY